MKVYDAAGREKVASVRLVARGTSLPSSPVDGQLYNYIVDDTNGIEWALVYDSSQGKWRKVGGPALYASVDTNEATASSSYTDLATVGPTVTAPLAGQYLVEFGSHVIAVRSGNGSDTQPQASFAVGGTAAIDADSIYDYTADSAGQTNRGSYAAKRSKTCAASDAVKMKYKRAVGSAGSMQFEKRWISIDPIYVS